MRFLGCYGCLSVLSGFVVVVFNNSLANSQVPKGLDLTLQSPKKCLGRKL